MKSLAYAALPFDGALTKKALLLYGERPAEGLWARHPQWPPLTHARASSRAPLMVQSA
jgi:hypothetical protein